MSARLTRAGSREHEALVDRVWADAPEDRAAALEVVKRVLPVSVSASLNAKQATAEQLLQACVDRNVSELCELLLARWPGLKHAYFVWAAGFGKEALVERLLEEGVPIDARDSMGRTALIALACTDWKHPEEQLHLARLLLEKGCPPAAATPTGVSALLLAIHGRRYSLAGALLEAMGPGALGGNDAALEGCSLLHLLASSATENYLSYDGSIADLARQMAAAGASPNSEHELGVTPLLFAVGQAAKAGLECRQLLSLIEVLLELGANAAAVDSEGKGALLYLTTSTSTRRINTQAFQRLVTRLVAAGAAVDQPHPDSGVTPLARMCIRAVGGDLGHPGPLLRALVAAGADPLANQPVSLLHLALLSASDTKHCHGANLVVRELAALGCNMQATCRGLTGVQYWLVNLGCAGNSGPAEPPPSWSELHCLAALLDCGCPLHVPGATPEREAPADASLRMLARLPPSWWLSQAVMSRSGAVLSMLASAFPEAAQLPPPEASWRPTPLEQAAHRLNMALAAASAAKLAQPFEGALGSELAWFCRVADALMAAGGPPARATYPVLHGLAPSYQRELSFLQLMARGQHWSRATNSLCPPLLRLAARQLLLINELRGFGAAPSAAAAKSEPASAPAGRVTRSRSRPQEAGAGGGSGAGGGGRAGGRRKKRRAGPPGVQLPDDLLDYILGLAARPMLAYVPQLHRLCRSEALREGHVPRCLRKGPGRLSHGYLEYW